MPNKSITMRSDFKRYIKDPDSLEKVTEATDIPHDFSKHGCPVVAFEGKRLHSFVNPIQEAIDWVESHAERIVEVLDKNQRISITILGPGLGYGIKALEDFLKKLPNTPQHVSIVCLEACPEIARKALSLAVWEPTKSEINWQIVTESTKLSDILNDSEHTLIMEGTAGYQLRKSVYEGLYRKSRTTDSKDRNLKVLVPTPLYGGSLPAAYHSADALKELGYDVELMDLSIYNDIYQDVEKLTKKDKHRRSLRALYASFLAECIVARAIECKADMVWAVAQTPLTPPALRELKHLGIKSALWFVEDYLLFDYWKEICLDYDAIFTIQKGEFHKQLASLGVQHYAYLPCAANPKVHFPEQLNAEEQQRYGSKLSFVGAGYYNRQVVFSQMRNQSLKIWGNDWPQPMVDAGMVMEAGRRISTVETRNIFNSSDININLHSSPSHSALNSQGDFVNPRTFEIAACGAFQIVDNRSLLSELFNSDELATFSTIEEMNELIGKFGVDNEGRRVLAQRARERVLREHTYERRLESAMSFMKDVFPDLKKKSSSTFIDSLIDAVPEDSEMSEYLKQFDKRTVNDLDSLVSNIKLGNGKLTRPEGILLLMKEFRDWGVEKGVIS